MKPTTYGKGNSSATRPALMRSPTAEERRRAQRVLLRVPVALYLAGRAKPVQATTHTVSANGAMIEVLEPLAQGTKLTVENLATRQRVEVTVVRPPQLAGDGSLLPVEFSAPAPNFWNVFFPPSVN